MAILIPQLDADESALFVYLQSQVREGKDGETGEFLSALDRDVSHIDIRAVVDDIEINHVEIVGSDLHVTYLVHYSVYNACKDMNVVDWEECNVVGRRTDEGWEFEECEPLPKRVPSDDI